jgi:hypothetical protein
MLYDSTTSEETSSESEDDLELLLLDAMLTPKRHLGPRINLQDIDEFQCEQWFRYVLYYALTTVIKRKTTKMYHFFFCRFQKRDMERLYFALNLPEIYTCCQGTTATGLEALMIMLRRLAYPSRLCDLVTLFGRTEQELSGIFAEVYFNICYQHSFVTLVR